MVHHGWTDFEIYISEMAKNAFKFFQYTIPVHFWKSLFFQYIFQYNFFSSTFKYIPVFPVRVATLPMLKFLMENPGGSRVKTSK